MKTVLIIICIIVFLFWLYSTVEWKYNTKNVGRKRNERILSARYDDDYHEKLSRKERRMVRKQIKKDKDHLNFYYKPNEEKDRILNDKGGTL